MMSDRQDSQVNREVVTATTDRCVQYVSRQNETGQLKSLDSEGKMIHHKKQ